MLKEPIYGVRTAQRPPISSFVSLEASSPPFAGVIMDKGGAIQLIAASASISAIRRPVFVHSAAHNLRSVRADCNFWPLGSSLSIRGQQLREEDGCLLVRQKRHGLN
jgi:hypothetical protein